MFPETPQVFKNPKPSTLIRELLAFATDPDSVVLDSFAGSGTTAHAVLAQNRADGGNRRFILVECEDYADSLTAERVRRVIKGVPGARDVALKAGLGGTFSYFELGRPMRQESLLDCSHLPSWEKLASRLFFRYRNRARKDYYVQGWKPRRVYADFIVTLRGDEPGAGDDFHQVFVVETKGVHLKASEDTEYKRSVFDICSEHARKADWAEFVPAMRTKVVRFEVVDEDEWQARLNGLLFAERA